MKSYIFFILLLFFSAITFAQINLIPNNDFEEWDSFNTNPREWSRFLVGSWERSTDAQSGEASLLLEIAPDRDFNFIFTEDISLKLGTIYNGSIAYKIASGNFTEIQFRLVDNSGVFPATVDTFNITDFTSDDWLEATFFYENTQYNSLSIAIYVYGGGTNEMLLDNVFFGEEAPLSIVDFTKTAKTFAAYPNPVASGEELTFDTTHNVALYNMHGQKIVSRKNTKNLAIDGINPGVYFLENDKGHTSRIIVK